MDININYFREVPGQLNIIQWVSHLLYSFSTTKYRSWLISLSASFSLRLNLREQFPIVRNGRWLGVFHIDYVYYRIICAHVDSLGPHH